VYHGAPVNDQYQKIWDQLRRKELHDIEYGEGRYAPRTREEPDDSNPYGLEDSLGGLNG
jgi:hypothetical protein